MKKYRELLESVENGKEVEESKEEMEETLEEDRYEEELPGDEDMGMDSSLDMDDYDLDSELDMEIARDGLEDEYMGDDEEYIAPDLDADMDVDDELGSEEDDVIFNYTATIQLTGYDYPLVLQADDMEEIKTVMRVMQQSGLNPKGDYKWNSKTFEIELDESAENNRKREIVHSENGFDIVKVKGGGWADSYKVYKGNKIVSNWNYYDDALDFVQGKKSDKESVTEEADDNWAYDEGCEAAKADCKAGLGNYIGDPRDTVKDDKEMSSSEKQKYMKGYKKTLDDKGYKLSGSGEKTQIVKK